MNCLPIKDIVRYHKTYKICPTHVENKIKAGF